MQIALTHAVALIAAIAALSSYMASAQIETQFEIGIEESSTYEFLQAKPEIMRHNFTTTSVFFNFTLMNINASSLIPTAAVQLTNYLRRKNYKAIVGKYYIGMAVATYTLGIPYFIDSERDFSQSEYLPNMFKFEIDYAQLNSTLDDISTVLNRKGFFILTDNTLTSSYFEDNLEGKPFIHKFVGPNATDSEIYNILIQNRNLLTERSWVLLFEPDNLIMIERIFNQSGLAGLLKFTDVYFIPSLIEKQHYLRHIRQSEVKIYTFLLENMQRYNSSQLRLAFLEDCIKHLAASIDLQIRMMSANFTLTNALNSMEISGTSGLYRYRYGRRFNATLSVMSIKSSATKDNFLEKIGSWTQAAPTPFSIDYSKQAGISNSIIRFAGVIDPPYLYRNKEGKLTGLSIDLIEVLKSALGFRYEIIFVDDGVYGSLTANNTWNGIMKYLVENRADISANFLAATGERLQFVDISVNLLESGISMMTKRSVYKLDFFRVFYPFSWFVWLSILFSMIVLTATLWVSDKISPNVQGKSIFSIMESFFLVFSSFLMSKVETEPRKPSARLFTLLLWFSTLVYMTTYVSNLVPFLIKPDDSVPFTSIADLYNVSDYRYVFLQNAATYNTAIRKWPFLLNKGRSLWPDKLLQPSVQEAVDLVLNSEGYVFIGSASTIKYESTKYCSIKIPGGVEEVLFETLLIRRGFLFTNDIRNELAAIRYGAFSKLEQKYFSLNRCPDSVINPNDKTPLGFNYFAGLFALVGVGAALGFLYILVHWIFKRVHEFVSRTRGKRLRYGNVYDSEIIKIVKDGLWIGIHGRRQFYFIANSSLDPDPTKIKNAKAQGFHAGDMIKVQYFGKDEATNNRIFTRLFDGNLWNQIHTPENSDSD